MPELLAPEVLQTMKRYEENFQYYARHYSELKEKHRGMYIAIDQRTVVAENSDHSELPEHLRQRFTDTRPIFIQYVSIQ